MPIDTDLDATIIEDGKCPGCVKHNAGPAAHGGYCKTCLKQMNKAAMEPYNQAALAKRELAHRELCRRRLLPFTQRMVPGYKAGWFHSDLAARLERFSQRVANGESPRLIISTPPRHGKLCADSTPVLTTEGWTTHGALEPGDFVFHPSGYPTRVVAVSEPGIAAIEVEVSGDEVVKVHENHEWQVRVVNRRTPETRVLETNYWLRPLKKGVTAGKPARLVSSTGRQFFQLPTVSPLRHAPRDLPIDPYVLGAWLGDGDSDAARFTHAEGEEAVIGAIEAAGYPVNNTIPNGRAYRTSFGGGLRRALRQLGVLWNKHIPEAYINASLDQRLRLLAGLIDTDGTVGSNGQVRFHTASSLLRDQYTALARSIGAKPGTTLMRSAGSATVNGLQCDSQALYEVYFSSPIEIPTEIERKRVRKIDHRPRGITAVRQADTPEIGRCIQVEAEDGLYLVGRTLIPTHNSELASKSMVAWHLGRNPEHRVISATHSDRLAMDNSRDVLRYIKDDRFRQLFPDVELDKDNKGAMGWRTEQGGAYKPVGAGAGVSGYGAHVLVIDDIHRDRDAYSQTVRDSIWQWYTSSARTRMLPGGGQIVIGTRWVLDDLIGRLLDSDGVIEEDGVWEYVRFAAQAEKDEYRLPTGRIIDWAHPSAKLLRREGEFLHPERYGQEQLKDAMRDPVVWQALYQNNPTAGDAAQYSEDMFELAACKMADIPSKVTYYTVWDTAQHLKERNDYTVGTTFGVDVEGTVWVVDVLRERMEADDLIETIFDNYERFNQDLVGIERTQYVVGLQSSLERRMGERRLHDFPYTLLDHGNKDKVQRSAPFRSWMRRGKVKIPTDAPWYAEFKKEHLEFPGGRHDDQVDTTGYFGQMLDDMTEPYQGDASVKKRESSWKSKLDKHVGRSGKSWLTA